MSLLNQLNLYVLAECSHIILHYRFCGKQQYENVLKQFTADIHHHPHVNGVCDIYIDIYYKQHRLIFLNYRNLTVKHDVVKCV